MNVETAKREIERWMREVGVWRDDDEFQDPAEHAAKGWDAMEGMAFVLITTGPLAEAYGPAGQVTDDFERMIGGLGLYTQKDESCWYFFTSNDPETDGV